MLVLEHQTKAEKRWDHEAFVEAFEVAIQTCPPMTHGDTPVPLQVLTSEVLLATILGMLAITQLWAMADGRLAPAASIPSLNRDASTTSGCKMPVPP